MKLIVGLWNPGNEYAKTRHNIGFVIVDDFVKGWKWDQGPGIWKYQNTWKWEVAEVMIEHQKVVFLKPMEFMNRSWWAVSALAHFYKILPEDILVIHDDIDLPVGKVQLKLWWSSAGHNWLKSIIEKLWTKDSAQDGAGFWRLRIGVDRPNNQDDVANYVLSPFTQEEKNLIDNKMNHIEEYIITFLSTH